MLKTIRDHVIDIVATACNHMSCACDTNMVETVFHVKSILCDPHTSDTPCALCSTVFPDIRLAAVRHMFATSKLRVVASAKDNNVCATDIETVAITADKFIAVYTAANNSITVFVEDSYIATGVNAAMISAVTRVLGHTDTTRTVTTVSDYGFAYHSVVSLPSKSVHVGSYDTTAYDDRVAVWDRLQALFPGPPGVDASVVAAGTMPVTSFYEQTLIDSFEECSNDDVEMFARSVMCAYPLAHDVADIVEQNGGCVIVVIDAMNIDRLCVYAIHTDLVDADLKAKLVELSDHISTTYWHEIRKHFPASKYFAAIHAMEHALRYPPPRAAKKY